MSVDQNQKNKHIKNVYDILPILHTDDSYQTHIFKIISKRLIKHDCLPRDTKKSYPEELSFRARDIIIDVD